MTVPANLEISSDLREGRIAVRTLIQKVPNVRDAPTAYQRNSPRRFFITASRLASGYSGEAHNEQKKKKLSKMGVAGHGANQPELLAARRREV